MTDSSNAKKPRYPIDMDEQLKSGSDEKTASPSEGESQGASIHRGTQSNPILMTPELFEKLYPAPYTAATGRCSDLRSSLGNPSPLALVGLLVGLTPLACDQMGWRGAGGNGAASIGAFYFVGGLLLLISGILDFILGNTFLFVVFTSYGGYFLAYGATLQPIFNAAGAYSSTGTDEVKGEISPGFQASFGFFLLAMMILNLIFLICSIRTNICLFIIFLAAVTGFGLITGSCWNLALSNSERALILQKGGGACFFISCLTGLYLFCSQLFEAVDFPIHLPVGDFSYLINLLSRRRNGNDDIISDV